MLLKHDWLRANQSYAAGSLVAVKLNKGVLGQAQCLFAPQAGQSVEGVETTRHFVAATLLDNVSSYSDCIVGIYKSRPSSKTLRYNINKGSDTISGKTGWRIFIILDRKSHV